MSEGERVVVLGMDVVKVKATGGAHEEWAHVFHNPCRPVCRVPGIYRYRRGCGGAAARAVARVTQSGADRHKGRARGAPP